MRLPAERTQFGAIEPDHWAIAGPATRAARIFHFRVEAKPGANPAERLLDGAIFVRTQVENIDLASWILDDRLKVRFQIQMHKYIWHPETRGV